MDYLARAIFFNSVEDAVHTVQKWLFFSRGHKQSPERLRSDNKKECKKRVKLEAKTLKTILQANFKHYPQQITFCTFN